MKKVEVGVELILTTHMTVDVEDEEEVREKVRCMIYGWETDFTEEYRQLIHNARLEYAVVEEISLKQKVRLAINLFDPYGLDPGGRDGAPLDEYDYLSDRIYRKLTPAYTVEQIGELVGREFSRSFGRNFPFSETIHVAQSIYDYIHA